jgi:anti-sigma factor RsiW
MKDVENNIERLIVRALDGEINEDDQLALNRELIRNPDARRLMEEYRHIDEMTALALGETLNNDPLPLDVADLPDQRAIQDSPRNIHRTWWLAVGAVAAGLLAAVSARYFVSAPAQSIVANNTAQASRVQHIPPLSPSYHPQDDVVRNAGMNNKPRIKRSAGRDAFGVMGDDGNIYWIEVDRVWTLKKARPGTVLGRSSEGL